MKFRTCALIILIFNINVYSQKIQSKVHNLYYLGINHYLAPDTNNFKREVMFLCIPARSPEYSISIEFQEGAYFLNFRSFKSNYWDLVWTRFMRDAKNTKMIVSEIDSTGNVVSKKFADKLEFLFRTTITDDTTSFSEIPKMVGDGGYWLLYKKNVKKVWAFDISNIKSYNQLVKLCESLAGDIINATFNEMKYINIIDSLIKTEIN